MKAFRSKDGYEDELCTQVPPKRTRAPPVVVGVPALGVDGCWLSSATVLASSYVVPPIMKMIMS